MFQLEDKQLFSGSLLWTLQRKYFDEMGFAAWQLAEVPQYVTSNPRIANSYAEMIFAVYKDSKTKATTEEPIYILETGAGSGRFAFYLLKRLAWLCNEAGVAENTFRYILSDFTQKNLDFWMIHPCLQTYIDNGTLDIALFDMTLKEDLDLQLSKKTIRPGSLQNPLIVIANYVFDSIPQDLFYGNAQQINAIRVTSRTAEDPADLTPKEVLEQITYDYHHTLTEGDFYPEPLFNAILDHYRRIVENAYFFFPATGIRSLMHLRSFSQTGMILLTADKGDHRFYNVLYPEAPGIVRHGSFSLSVNYHIIGAFCEEQKGLALFPGFEHGSINTGCLFFMDNAEACKETILAYKKYITESGPDDYFTLYRSFNNNIDSMAVREILSAIRFSLHDSRTLAMSLARLQQLVPEMTVNDRVDIVNLINSCWENYYPLGERTDLANQIALLLYDMGVYNLAEYYFKLSVGLYGNDTGTMFNIAACYHLQGDKDNAKLLLHKVLEHDPQNGGARELLEQCEADA